MGSTLLIRKGSIMVLGRMEDFSLYQHTL
jgi:hypothetical protein